MKRTRAALKRGLEVASPLWHRYAAAIAILAGLLLGVLAFRLAVGVPVIKVVEISGSLDSAKTDRIVPLLDEMEDNRSVRGVVLSIDSPGGEAGAVERLYMRILKFREKKPLVAVIKDTGASGAYYIAVATNHIFAAPSSAVGSIGVYSVLPRPERIGEDTIITGLYKRTPPLRRERVADIQQTAEGFYRAVMHQRGERLKVPKEELQKAKVYSGVTALQHGLIDAIGGETDAVEKAAALAGARRYAIVRERTPAFSITFSLNETALEPGDYYLMAGERDG